MIYLHIYTLEQCTKKQISHYSKVKLRENISYYLQQDADEIQFSYNSNGKPSTENLSFSVSHSREKLVHVYTKSGEIGVDIEYKDHNRKYMKLVKRYFHQQEYSYLKTLNKSQSRDVFFQLWTAKEAVCKAQGGRLWSYLAESYLNQKNALKDSIQELKLKNISNNQDYALTLATEKDQDVQTVYA